MSIVRIQCQDCHSLMQSHLHENGDETLWCPKCHPFFSPTDKEGEE